MLSKYSNCFVIRDSDFLSQALLLRLTLDSIFKVGFGVDLNCLQGSDADGNEFIKAFDDSNELVYWRYADPLWRLKRYLDIGGEATLKKNIKFIHNFVDNVIRTKREQVEKEKYYVSTNFLFSFSIISMMFYLFQTVMFEE